MMETTQMVMVVAVVPLIPTMNALEAPPRQQIVVIYNAPMESYHHSRHVMMIIQSMVMAARIAQSTTIGCVWGSQVDAPWTFAGMECVTQTQRSVMMATKRMVMAALRRAMLSRGGNA